jgi:hypothetical protein
MKLFETVNREDVYKTFQSTFKELKARDKRFQVLVGNLVWNDLNQQRNLYHDNLGESLSRMVKDYKSKQDELRLSVAEFSNNPEYVYANIMECIFNGVSDNLVFNKMMNEVIAWLAWVEILNAAATKVAKV